MNVAFILIGLALLLLAVADIKHKLKKFEVRINELENKESK